MPDTYVNDNTCKTSLQLLGDYWTLRIIDSLQKEELRYCEIQRAVDNVNPVTLTNRLKRLEKAKLVAKSKKTQDKISVSYSLTKLGRDALPVIKAVNKFSEKSKKY
jgi:DNA-binding HxlR family transcriptional regulator